MHKVLGIMAIAREITHGWCEWRAVHSRQREVTRSGDDWDFVSTSTRCRGERPREGGWDGKAAAEAGSTVNQISSFAFDEAPGANGRRLIVTPS